MSTGYGEENIYRKYGQPTLDLVFTGAKKSLTDRVGNVAVEFSRTTTATYVGSDGLIKTAAVDEARFDHDPTTGESLGLLIEESRTNGVIQSQDLTTWTKTNVTLDPVTATAPDGTSTAKKLIADITNGTHRVQRGASISSSNVAFSFYAKAAEESVIVFAALNNTGNNRQAIFDLAAETATLVETDSTWNPRLEKYANGWYRCIVETTTSRVPTFVETFYIRTTDAWTGDGVGGLYIWGYQVEEGSFPTSYIPTTVGISTRGADTASITGAGFSSFYNQSEGTLLQSFVPKGSNVTYAGRLYQNSTNYTGSYINPITRIVHMYRTPTAENVLLKTGVYVNTKVNLGMSYDAVGFSGCHNGTAVQTSSSIVGTQSTLTQLLVGGGTQHISRLTYWPKRLPDSDLQSLTE